MSENDKHSKTEQPTAKRLADAKGKGGTPDSRDLSSTVSLMAAVIALYATGGFMLESMKKISRDMFAGIGHHEITQTSVYNLMLKLSVSIGLILSPFILSVMATGVIIGVIQQGGFRFSVSKLALNFSHMNPLTGMKKFFGKSAKVEMLKSFLKLAIVAWVAYRILKDEVQNLAYLTDGDLQGIFAFTGHICYKIVMNTCGVLMVLSVLDLLYVKWNFVQELKMTKQEVKDENKDMEGDPQVKSKIKGLQFQKAFQRLQKIIPTADVIITNPTHFAVALKYDRDRMAAPVVIAKGADFMAQRIKALARENNITLVENRFLARELYAQVKEGEEIPEALYAAVAEVLAYVYRLKGMM